ncbi:hypothetical protein E2542_SST28683 [Spatholobus suberectus]|nr:hypothetical protein E2542_SST28683 [Spatholobus suberectus]
MGRCCLFPFLLYSWVSRALSLESRFLVFGIPKFCSFVSLPFWDARAHNEAVEMLGSLELDVKYEKLSNCGGKSLKEEVYEYLINSWSCLWISGHFPDKICIPILQTKSSCARVS